jgi:hypothetical protein
MTIAAGVEVDCCCPLETLAETDAEELRTDDEGARRIGAEIDRAEGISGLFTALVEDVVDE